MNFSYSRQGLDPRAWAIQRFLEILPAALSWSLLLSLFFLCFFVPVAGVVAIILFDLYWLFRLIYFTIFLVLSYALLEAERSVQWRDRLRDLEDPSGAIVRIQAKMREQRNEPSLGVLRRWKILDSEAKHLASLERLTRAAMTFPHPRDIFHLIILPFYQEGAAVLEPTLEALTRIHYPLDRLVVVLGVEERAGPKARELAESLLEKYRKSFYHLETCLHPEDVPGEAAVKGANSTHAAKWAKTFLESRRIPLDHILVSCFDADTVVSPEYFACLTYNYLVHPKRTRASFQPIPVYHNNLWEAPPFARVLETGSSFLQLIEATDPEQLVTFSSHSMSFQALVEIGYWPVDLISDDSAIFWKAYLAFDGDYRVEPLYVTLSMDVAVGKNLWETCQFIYRQKRRWAWGVENFPILLRGFMAHPRIPFILKLKHAIRLLEMNVSWATWTPIMLILSWAPALVVTREFVSSVAHFNAPRVAGVICNLAIASLAISIILSFFLLPKRPKPVPLWEKFIFALQWLAIPLIATVFGALPALDAQTRLAFGRTMEFFVTPKGAPRKSLEETPARLPLNVSSRK